MKMKKCILICDDDLDILELCRYILEKNDYRVETFSNYNDVIGHIDEIQPDIMLIDLWMPGIGGEEAAIKLKSDKATSHIPLLLFSANNEIDQIALSVNANGYIRKPFDTNDILTVIEKNIRDPEEQI